MALINDPDDLNQSTQAASGTPDGEVFINTATSTIELISSTDGYGASNLIAADGVELQALYSFLKEEWKSDANLIKYTFPMEAITSEQFEFINGWTLNDTTTASRTYIRRGGWAEKNTSGAVTGEYMGVITLGTFTTPASQKAYYFWAGDTTKTDFTYFGPVNEAVKIYEDTNGDGTPDFDYRTTVLTVAIRPDTTGASGSVEGYTYDSSTNTAIGASTITYQTYRFPLSSSVDLDLTLTDAEITSLETSKTFTLTWYGSDQASSTYLSPDLNGGPYQFRIVIDNATNNATPSEVYNWVQWSLRQGNVDIDDGGGTEYAFATPALTTFVGPVLETYDIDSSASLGGVLIGSIDTNEAANFKMRDNGGTLRIFPAISSGKFVFNTNLIEDAASKYWLFFDNAGGNTYPGSTAIIVDNYAGTDLTGDIHATAATPATGGASGTGTGSATAAGFVMTVSGETWTIDDLIDNVLVITSGNNAGYYWVTDNTATTVTVDVAFEATDAAMNWELRDKNTTGEIIWDFDYTNNTQGGRTGGTDAAVSIVALGLRTGQYVLATGNTIIDGSGQNFSATAALERNYADPT